MTTTMCLQLERWVMRYAMNQALFAWVTGVASPPSSSLLRVSCARRLIVPPPLFLSAPTMTSVTPSDSWSMHAAGGCEHDEAGGGGSATVPGK